MNQSRSISASTSPELVEQLWKSHDKALIDKRRSHFYLCPSLWSGGNNLAFEVKGLVCFAPWVLCLMDGGLRFNPLCSQSWKTVILLIKWLGFFSFGFSWLWTWYVPAAPSCSSVVLLSFNNTCSLSSLPVCSSSCRSYTQAPTHSQNICALLSLVVVILSLLRASRRC